MTFEIDQWEALPWHHQQAYLEELAADFPDVFGPVFEAEGEEPENELVQAQRLGLNIRYIS